MDKNRLVIGVSGASGAPVAVEMLRALRREPDWETHLILTAGAERTIPQETGMTPGDMRALADICYDNGDLGAAPASGTYPVHGMVVAPCSMKTAAGIACGYSDNLLLRAADVTLKERRRLVLAARETPLHAVHLRNLLTLTELGAVVAPLMLSYYHHPGCVEDMTRHMAGKILDCLGIVTPLTRRWNPGREGA